MPPEDVRATAIGNMREKFGEDRTCSSENMIADRHTHKQTDTLIREPCSVKTYVHKAGSKRM